MLFYFTALKIKINTYPIKKSLLLKDDGMECQKVRN